MKDVDGGEALVGRLMAHTNVALTSVFQRVSTLSGEYVQLPLSGVYLLAPLPSHVLRRV